MNIVILDAGQDLRTIHTTERQPQHQQSSSPPLTSELQPDENGGGKMDSFADNLDMDAIIQSFIHEQQRGVFIEPSAGRQANYPTYYTQQTGSALPTLPDSSHISETVYAEGWSTLPTRPHGKVEDMLFGFNGAALDGYLSLWFGQH